MTNKNSSQPFSNPFSSPFSSQRWLISNFDNTNSLAAQFLKLDKFLRQFPNLQLETNEYLITVINGQAVLARRMTGFVDQLPEGYEQKDWLCRDLSEIETSWDDLNAFLDQPRNDIEGQLQVFVVSGLSLQENEVSIAVRKRVIEVK